MNNQKRRTPRLLILVLVSFLGYSAVYVNFRISRSHVLEIAGDRSRLILFTPGITSDDFDFVGTIFTPAMWIDSWLSGDAVGSGPKLVP